MGLETAQERAERFEREIKAAKERTKERNKEKIEKIKREYEELIREREKVIEKYEKYCESQKYDENNEKYTKYIIIAYDQVEKNNIKYKEIVELAEKKGYKLITGLTEKFMNDISSDPDVTDIITHTHGNIDSDKHKTKKGLTVDTLMKDDKGNIIFKRNTTKLVWEEKTMIITEIFEPKKCKGKNIRPYNCFPYSNIKEYTEEYKKEGGTLEYVYQIAIDSKEKDRVTIRDDNREKIIIYLKSLPDE